MARSHLTATPHTLSALILILLTGVVLAPSSSPAEVRDVPGRPGAHRYRTRPHHHMNRGHAVMERTRVADFDGAGHAMATLSFLNVTQGVWTVGEGNSWTESITLWSGGWQGGEPGGEPAALVVYDAMRPAPSGAGRRPVRSSGSRAAGPGGTGS